MKWFQIGKLLQRKDLDKLLEDAKQQAHRKIKSYINI